MSTPNPNPTPTEASTSAPTDASSSTQSSTTDDSSSLLSLSDIARMAQVRPSAVSNWRSRNRDFPQPSGRSARGDLYELADVLAWLKAKDKIGQTWELGVLLRSLSAHLPADQHAGLILALLHLAARQRLHTHGVPPGQAADEATWQLAAHNLRQVAQELGVDSHLALLESIADPGVLARNASLLGVLDSMAADAPAAPISDALAGEHAHQQGKLSEATSAALQALLAALVWRQGSADATASAELPHPPTGVNTAAATRSGHTLLDPTVGTGGLLLAAAAAHPHGTTGIRHVWAADVRAAEVAVTGLRLALAQVPATVRAADVLSHDPFAGVKADAVVLDPPYGLRAAGDLPPALRAALGRSTNASLDWAWVLYAADHLTATGRAVVLLPTGALSRQGPDGEARAEVLRRGLIEAVITLPAGLARHTQIPLAALVLRAPGTLHRTADILMIDAAQADLPWQDHPAQAAHRVTQVFQDTQTPADDLSANATQVALLDALAPGASLTPTHWLTRASTVDPTAAREDLRHAQEQLDRARDAAVRLAAGLTPTAHGAAQPSNAEPLVRLAAGLTPTAHGAAQPSNAEPLVRLAAGLTPTAHGAAQPSNAEPPAPASGAPDHPHESPAPTWATVGELVDHKVLRLHRGPNVTHSELGEHGVPVLTVTSVTRHQGQPTGHLDPHDDRLQRTRLTRPGDVVFATIGAKAMVDTTGGHFPGGHLTVIEVLEPDTIRPKVLAAYLSTPTVAALAEGTTIQRVDPRRVPVPLLPPEQADSLTRALDALDQQATAAETWAQAASQLRQTVVTAVGVGVQL